MESLSWWNPIRGVDPSKSKQMRDVVLQILGDAAKIMVCRLKIKALYIHCLHY